MPFILLLFYSFAALAAPVLHQIRPDSTFSQISTLEACSFMIGRRDSVECNPALFPYQSSKGVSFNLATVTDGDSVETGKTLIFSKVKKEDIQEIFDKKAFTSLDANSSIKFMTPFFFLYYRPMTVSADILVLNPAFPEISMALIKNKQIGASSGFEAVSNDYLKLSLGANVFHYQRSQYLGSFSLVDLTSNDIDDLITFEDKNGVAADLGMNIIPKSKLLPQVSFLVKNLGSDFKNKDKDVRAENKLRPLLMYETYSRLGLAYRFDFLYGGLGLEVNAPFENVYGIFLPDYTTVGMGYLLGGFEITGAASKFQKNIGFKFLSKSLTMGIFYGFNQSLGDYYSREEKLAGIQLQVNL